MSGFLVHPTDHKQYAERILALLENKNLQEDFGIAARQKIVTTFSVEIVARQSVLFYEGIIKSK